MNPDRPAATKGATTDLIGTAKRLRAARAACRQFLMLWALNQAASRKCDGSSEAIEAALADPQDHDWTILYRGSVLDD